MRSFFKSIKPYTTACYKKTGKIIPVYLTRYKSEELIMAKGGRNNLLGTLIRCKYCKELMPGQTISWEKGHPGCPECIDAINKNSENKEEKKAPKRTEKRKVPVPPRRR